MQLVRCDKCGCIRKPKETRRVSIALGQGPNNAYGKYTWNDKEVCANYQLDLCFNCWSDFADKIENYIKA